MKVEMRVSPHISQAWASSSQGGQTQERWAEAVLVQLRSIAQHFRGRMLAGPPSPLASLRLPLLPCCRSKPTPYYILPLGFPGSHCQAPSRDPGAVVRRPRRFLCTPRATRQLPRGRLQGSEQAGRAGQGRSGGGRLPRIPGRPSRTGAAEQQGGPGGKMPLPQGPCQPLRPR